MSRKYFGTDGVRGVFGEDLTADLVERLGAAYGTWSQGESVLVGRDTRASGPELERALVAGLAAAGSQAVSGGILPTPAVALLAEESGAVVSASHNPPVYNGVKFFRRGWKLEDEDEEAIEALLGAANDQASEGPQPAEDARSGRYGDDYVELVCERFGAPLEWASHRGRLRERGDVRGRAQDDRVARCACCHYGQPTGRHEYQRGLRRHGSRASSRTVADGAFDLGVAFDGDGDRMLAVDAEGRPLDGDEILAVVALYLGVDLVAVTEMTNLGFHRLMEANGVRVLTTAVGDRYVLEALRREGGKLGGEQSGHIMYLEGQTTGDGLVGAILLCRALRERGGTLQELASQMTKLPQAKANVPVRSKEFPEALREEIDRLAAGGRVVVRPSGTEPVVRILVEAETKAAAESLCGTIATLVSRELG